jgi:hypothetical protein
MKKRKEELPYTPATSRPKGTGPGSAGQSGDTQGLSDEAEADSESVEELAEEGQGLEADAVAGVEDEPDEPKRVRTRQVPMDDVPPEYENPD